MSIEIAALAGSSAAGIISAAVLDKYSRKKERKAKDSTKTGITSTKSELSSLLFEKSLCSEAITRVYEAAQKGKIDPHERDRLLLKYKQQLESINARASQLQLVTDYADLTDVRNNLSYLLENRISAIDTKLLEMSKRVLPSAVVDDQLLRIVEDVSTRKKKDLAPRAESPEEEQQLYSSPEEKSIEQLQRDILQALQRLEQVEVDKD